MPMMPLDQLNATLKSTQARWVAKPNPIMLLSDSDRRRRLGLIVDEHKRALAAAKGDIGPAAAAAAAAAPLPSSVDWRNRNGRNCVTPVKDQGGCGSCVSFCVTATLESMLLIERNQTRDLSEADLHFCSDHGANCDGWWPEDAIDEVKARGITSESEFPYASAFSGGNPSCKLSVHRDINAVRLVEGQSIWTVPDRKAWLANVGPICASFEVFEDFYAYGSGVYEHKTGGHEGYHCVQVIGYSDIERCWICKNSWGAGWGDNGFFKIGYTQCRIDPGNPAPLFSTAFAMHGMNGTVILPEFKVPNQLSKASPAIGLFNGRLHMVHLGDSSNNIWHSSSSGDVWTPNVTIPNQKSKAAPALAPFGGKLHMVHLGDSSNDIWHSSFDGNSWTPNVQIPGQKSKARPAITPFGSTICMLHLGDSSNDIWHSFFNGQTWSTNVKINQRSKATPGIAVYQGVVHMVRLDESSNDLWYSTFNGTQWTASVKIQGQLSKAAPALVVFQDKLQMVHLGNTSNNIWHSILTGGTWSPNVTLPLRLSKASPALADFVSHLQMLHIGDSSNQIWQGWIA
jgi:hypothetical protein